MEESPTIRDLGAKLDQDFLLYLSFVKTHYNNLENDVERATCQKWLERLCANQAIGFDEKQKRNIFLSELLQCMQEKKLHSIFREWPPQGPLPDPTSTFDPNQAVPNIESFATLDNENIHSGGFSSDGRTYFATKRLNNNRGMCAYLAVSVAENEPRWIDQEILKRQNQLTTEINIFSQELESTLDSLENHYREEGSSFTPENRKDIGYQLKHIVELIDQSLDYGQSIDDNVQPFYEALQNDIKKSPHWIMLSKMCPEKMNKLILELLRDKINSRINKILDIMSEYTQRQPSDTLWEEAAKRRPTNLNMRLLEKTYSYLLIEKFLNLLAIERAEIVQRTKLQHEKAVEEMRNEIRQELKNGLNKYDEAKRNWNRSVKALKLIEETKKRAEQYKLKKEINLHTDSDEGNQEAVTMQLLSELEDAENRFELTNMQKEKLNKELSEELERFKATSSINNSSIEQLNEDIDLYKNEMENIQKEITQQKIRIDSLRHMIDQQPVSQIAIPRMVAIDERETEKTTSIKRISRLQGPKVFRK